MLQVSVCVRVMLRADMHCRNYLPVCYPTRDMNVGANGSMWPLYNFDQTWKNGHDNDVRPPCSMKQDMGYEKEVLKQTMIKQEAIFINQLSELHRLYRRQRELMDDVKRRPLLQCQTQPDFYCSELNPELVKKACYTPTLSWVKTVLSGQSVLSMKNFQASSSSSAEKTRQTGLDSLLAESRPIASQLLSPKSNKPGKKRMLDLELPADEYIDSEDGEQFEEGRVFETPLQYDSKLLPAAFEGGFHRNDSLLRKSNDIVDLNGPIQVEEEETLNFGSLLGHNIQVGRNIIACLEIVNMQVDRQKELARFNHEDEICPKQHHKNGSLADSPSLGGMSALQNNLLLESQLESIALKATNLDALNCENYSCPTSEVHDLTKPFNEVLKSSKGMGFDHLSSGEDNKPSGSRFLLDLNSCISKEDESDLVCSVSIAMTKTAMAIDLEAPASPENKEGSPPRGASEETQLETSVQLAKQGDEDPQWELVRVAAESLVTISSSEAQLHVDNKCLLWFAGIVSSLTGNLETDHELLPRRIDDFEEELERDVRVKACSCQGNGLKGNREGVMLLPSHQRKGRTKRLRQRKDHQTVVLPCFASPSRSKTNKISGAELGPIEAGLTGWGKMKRRQRGRQIPASNLYLVFQMGAALSN